MITSRAARIVFVAGLLAAASACYVPEQPFVISIRSDLPSSVRVYRCEGDDHCVNQGSIWSIVRPGGYAQANVSPQNALDESLVRSSDGSRRLGCFRHTSGRSDRSGHGTRCENRRLRLDGACMRRAHRWSQTVDVSSPPGLRGPRMTTSGDGSRELRGAPQSWCAYVHAVRLPNRLLRQIAD